MQPHLRILHLEDSPHLPSITAWQAAKGDWRRLIDQQVVVRGEEGQVRDVMGTWHDITDLAS